MLNLTGFFHSGQTVSVLALKLSGIGFARLGFHETPFVAGNCRAFLVAIKNFEHPLLRLLVFGSSMPDSFLEFYTRELQMVVFSLLVIYYSIYIAQTNIRLKRVLWGAMPFLLNLIFYTKKQFAKIYYFSNVVTDDATFWAEVSWYYKKELYLYVGLNALFLFLVVLCLKYIAREHEIKNFTVSNFSFKTLCSLLTLINLIMIGSIKLLFRKIKRFFF